LMELELKLGGIEVEVKGLRGIVTLVGIGLVVAALLQELKQPPTDRSWCGSVLGCVPYDFRPPTLERVRQEFWNPESPDILSPHAFGVGWGINFGAVAKKLDLVA
jgi:Family of unknown function (DUF5808)